MWRDVVLAWTDVSDERIACIDCKKLIDIIGTIGGGGGGGVGIA
jgi:hypothetical protein